MPNLRIVPVNAIDRSYTVLGANPALVAGMTETSLQLIARDLVARSSSLASQAITFHFGGSIEAISCWAALRHNLLGAQIRLQLYSDYPALSTQIYDSGATDVYSDMPLWGDFNWGEVPWGVAANDPLATEAAFIRFLSQKYYAAGGKITITNPGGLSASFFEVGRIWLGEYFEVAINPDYGLQAGWASATERGRTFGGSLRPRPGARWREMRFKLTQISDAERAFWMDVLALLDMSKPCLVSGFPTNTDRKVRDYALEGLFAGLDLNTFEAFSKYAQPISIEET